MEKHWLFAGCAGAAAVMMLSGCTTQLAQHPRSDVEKQWAQAISSSYPGWKPPRTYAQAVQYDARQATQYAVMPQGEANALLPEAVSDEAPAPAADETPAVELEVSEPEVVSEPVETQLAPTEAVDAAAQAAPAPAAEVPAEEAPAAEDNGPAEVVVKPGDTLSGISKMFYGNAKYYDVILRANPQIKDPKKLKVGMKLVIPAL